MGTVTHFVDGIQAPRLIGTQAVIAENLLDFSSYNVAGSDVVQALKVPANTIVTRVWCIIKTAEGATATATVGDGTDANDWDASVDLNAAAGTLTSSAYGTDGYSTTSKFYASADTIDLVVSAALDTAKVIVKAEMLPVERYA